MKRIILLLLATATALLVANFAAADNRRIRQKDHFRCYGGRFVERHRGVKVYDAPKPQTPAPAVAPAPKPAEPMPPANEKVGIKPRSATVITLEQQLLECHNSQRGQPLTLDSALCQEAQAHAEWMARTGRFQHGNLRLAMAENIACGQGSPWEATSDWLRSPGHRANLTNPCYTRCGFGVFNNYWVAQFAP